MLEWVHITSVTTGGRVGRGEFRAIQSYSHSYQLAPQCLSEHQKDDRVSSPPTMQIIPSRKLYVSSDFRPSGSHENIVVRLVEVNFVVGLYLASSKQRGDDERF